MHPVGIVLNIGILCSLLFLQDLTLLLFLWTITAYIRYLNWEICIHLFGFLVVKLLFCIFFFVLYPFVLLYSIAYDNK